MTRWVSGFPLSFLDIADQQTIVCNFQWKGNRHPVNWGGEGGVRQIPGNHFMMLAAIQRAGMGGMRRSGSIDTSPYKSFPE